MSVTRITETTLTPEERKGLDRRERKRDGAELQLVTARNILKQAKAEVARARRELKDAEHDLTAYRLRVL